MTSSIPAWQPFELYGGWVPPVLELEAGHDPVEGRVVVISPTQTVRDRGWAPRAAVEMARGWASQGARVFLADLSLHDPEIHAVLEAENLEGVSDSLLYGASIQRVARPADDGAFFVATAGTAVADAKAVLGHPRWTGMTTGFMTAGVTLVLYLPLDMPGSDSLIQRGTHRILLARPGEVLDDLEEEQDDRVVAVLGPDGTMGEFMDPPLGHAPPIPVGAQGFDDPVAPDPLSPAAYSAAPRVEAPVAVADPAIVPEAEDVLTHAEPAGAVGRRSSPGVIGLVLVLLAAAIVVTLGLLGVIDLPFLTAATGRDAPPTELQIQPAATPPVSDARGLAEPTGNAALDRDGEVVTVVTDLDAAADAGLEALRTAADADEAASAAEIRTPENATSTSLSVTEAPAALELAFSLSLSAWEGLPAAVEHVRWWQARRPNRLFVVAPIYSGSQIYFRVLAGPAGDTGSAEVLRADLGSGVGDAEAAGWILRSTPLAFVMAETADRASADRTVAELDGQGIPAYVLQTIDGSGYRVYSGAYRNAEDARALSELIQDRGYPPVTLTERTGRLPG